MITNLKPPVAEATGSVDRLVLKVQSAWMEAHKICVETNTGVEVARVFEARDELRNVLYLLSSMPPTHHVSNPVSVK